MATQEIKIRKEALGSGQWLISANRDGFPRTLGRMYDEEAADLFVAALREAYGSKVIKDLPIPVQPPATIVLNEKPPVPKAKLKPLVINKTKARKHGR